MADEEKTEEQKSEENAEKTEDKKGVDWNAVDPATIPHHVVQQTQAFGGILRDAQSMRAKNQQLEESVNLLQNELQRQTEPLDEEEYMKRNQVEELLARERQKMEDERTKEKTAAQNTRETQSFNQLQEQLKEAPEGLDANNVIREGGSWLAVNKPALFNAARNSENPAKEIYDLALTFVPSIRQRAESAKSAALLDSLKRQAPEKGRGGAVAPSSTEASELMALINAPEEKLLTMIEEDELS